MKLITHAQNLRYLINFTGTSGFLLLGKVNFFCTDFRYRGVAERLQKSKTRIPFRFIEVNKNFEQKLRERVKGTLEFESKHMSIDELKQWKKSLKGVRFVPMKDTIEQLRLIKDADEIKKLKKSQELNEETLKRIKNLLKKGVSELEVAWKIKVIGHELGAEDISFEPIVAFGAHSAIPHHQNSNRKLKKGDVVLIDMGMKYQGYASDMTRTYFTQKPTNEQAKIYEKVLEAQETAIKAIRTGVKCAKMDELARKTMGRDAKYFGHSLGHGIGLDVHEAPRLSVKSKEILKENMVVTVEPGIYLPGRFGVRLEDMGRVTRSAYENFTTIEKDPFT